MAFTGDTTAGFLEALTATTMTAAEEELVGDEVKGQQGAAVSGSRDGMTGQHPPAALPSAEGDHPGTSGTAASAASAAAATARGSKSCLTPARLLEDVLRAKVGRSVGR